MSDKRAEKLREELEVSDDGLVKLAECLEKTNGVKEVRSVNETHQEIEATILLANPDWGLPTTVHSFMQANDLCIVDFDLVTKQQIDVHFGRR